jgi:hypothetical protein
MVRSILFRHLTRLVAVRIFSNPFETRFDYG